MTQTTKLCYLKSKLLYYKITNKIEKKVEKITQTKQKKKHSSLPSIT